MFDFSYYKILAMTEILIAEILFFIRLEKRSKFPLRLAAGIIVCYLTAIFFPVSKNSEYSAILTSVMFGVMFFVSFLSFLFTFKVSFSAAFFCCILAYTIRHLAYNIFSFIFSIFALPVSDILYGTAGIDFLNIGATEIWIIVGYFDLYILTYGIAYRIISRRIHRSGGLRLENRKMFFLVVLILLIDIVLNAVIVGVRNGYNAVHDYDVFVYSYDIVVYIYSILSCVLLLYVQFSMMHIKSMESEIESITHILHQSEKQYDANKENINLINIKCHDLKYQIEKFENRGVDKEVIEDIKRLISVYDLQIKTGNEVLDIILTEKGLACQAKGINLTCMADCKKLNYIREGDLYALFGNILDNAMDAVMNLDDAEKRCISINAREVKNYVSISVKNYFSGKITISENGLPVTTKEDKQYHGFGMLSIKTVVEKYGGTVSADSDGDIFILSIILPIKDN